MTTTPDHKLIDNTLVVEGTGPSKGVYAKCTCGWVSRPCFSGMIASIEFDDHVVAAVRADDYNTRHREV